jgi:hypothetical protein
MLSHATRYITKGFLDQGLSPQFVDMYEAVNRMTRKKVMECFEPDHSPVDAEENQQLVEQERILDQSAVNIDELWASLFGLSNATEPDPDLPQNPDNSQYRF